jgi:5-methylcytosine-specific restriction protein A
MTTSDARIQTRAYRLLRLWVLDRDRGQCQIRGPKCTQLATEVDHIVSRADGGQVFDPANLRAACRPCNAARGAAHTNDRRNLGTDLRL